MRSGVRVGHRDDDHETGVAGLAGKPFLAPDHPILAILYGARMESGWVRSALRLGHRETGDNLAVQQRRQETVLLLRRAVHGEYLRVAAVRRLAAEDQWAPDGTADDLVEQR